ncbi:MAG: hypothetical protein NTV34_16810, partial [Proteobacteria bacterium]|nr:hypothetical protein [Pseudomonadota bacterium]
MSIPSQTFVEGDRWLKLEWAADHLLHFEFGKGNSVDLAAPIHVSPLYKHSVFQGSSTFRSLSPQKFITRDMAVAVQGLCFTVNDRIQGNQAGSYCLNDIASPWKTLQVEAKSVRDAYGLGQIFGEPGKINGNRIGKNIQSDGDFGNMMQAYAGGAVGQTLFPVLYALEKTDRAWLLALDNIYKQAWDLRTPTWKIGMFGDRVAGFVMVGANPLDLRKKFMDLSGHAPVPPRKIFGFWMSEYGYDNWAEIDERLEGMRNDQFPIDGFFLD